MSLLYAVMAIPTFITGRYIQRKPQYYKIPL